MDINTKKVLFGFAISLICIAVILIGFDKIQSNGKAIQLEQNIKEAELLRIKSIEKVEQDKLNRFVFIIQAMNPKVDKGIALIIAKETLEKSDKHTLSPLFVLCLMYRESGFRPLVISKADCIGLMQINPKAHPEKVEPFEYYELFHIGNNIDIGCQILKEYSEGNSVKVTLKKYLGAHNNGYIDDILVMFTDMSMKFKEFI